MEKTFAFSSSVSDESVKRSVCHGRNRINRENSLDVITCEDGDSAVQSHTQSRVRNGSVASLDSTHPRRTPTPSKQISLKAARRKEDLGTASWLQWEETPFVSRETSAEVEQHSSMPSAKNANQHSAFTAITAESKPVEKKDKKNEEEEEEEEENAPNELIMEFLTCVMQKDFVNAKKLCKMVLLFEPENELALDFVETINEKLKLDEESAAEFDVDDSDDEDDYTDDDDDDDSDDSDDSDSNEDEKSEDDDEENDKDDDDGDDDDDDEEEEEEEVDEDHKQKEPFLAKERKCQISEKDYP